MSQSGAIVKPFHRVTWIGFYFFGIIAVFNLLNQAQAAPQFQLKVIADYFETVADQQLLQAALAGDVVTARQWRAQGGNPNAEGPASNQFNRITLLQYAIAANNVQAVKVLLALSSDPTISSPYSSSGLAFAIYLQKPALLAAILDQRPADTLSKDFQQELLFQAASSPDTACLELMLQRGFPIDLTDSLGRTALIDVLAAMDIERAEWLIQHGANVIIEDRGGITPAYKTQDYLARAKPGGEAEQKILSLKRLIEQRGVTFPVPTPQENRTRKATVH